MHPARLIVTKLSCFFFLLFTPFSSYMTILTHIYEQESLNAIGPASLACNYTTFIISTILAPACKLKLKTQIIIAAIAYTLNYSSGILASFVASGTLKYTISCLGAAIAGSTGGILWVSQGRYIHLVSILYNQQDEKGRLFGIFSTIYCLSNISAGLITTFGLGFFSPTIYFMLITAIGILAIIYCIFFVDDIQNNSELNNLLSEEPNYNLKQSLKSTISFIPKMFTVLPILLIDGISLGIYSSQITHLYPNPSDKLAGYLMISLGIGATIGGFICGIFVDRYKTVIAGKWGIFGLLLGCALCIASLEIKQYWVALLSSFWWGLFLFYIEGWMYYVCSRHFGGRGEAFSVNKQLHSIFYLLFQLVVIYSDNKLNLVLLMGWLAMFAIPAVILMDKIPNSNDPMKILIKQEQKQQE